MAFSFIGILSVILEATRPLIPYLIAWALVDVVLIVYTLKQGRFASAPARRLALWSGLGCAVAAFLFGPSFTQANFGNLIGAIDWILLAGMALAVGVVGFIFTLPVMSLIRS